MDSLGSLNAFVQAAEARSFTVAGRQLGVGVANVDHVQEEVTPFTFSARVPWEGEYAPSHGQRALNVNKISPAPYNGKDTHSLIRSSITGMAEQYIFTIEGLSKAIHEGGKAARPDCISSTGSLKGPPAGNNHKLNPGEFI